MLGFFLLIVASFILAYLWIWYNRTTDAKVMATSRKIELLLSLNQTIGFHDVTDCFEISRRYDNKSYFNKIEPAYLMTAQMREKINFYTDYAEKIRDNRCKKQIYQKKIQEILEMEEIIDYEALKLSQDAYHRRERKLFSKKTISPVVDCTCRVYMAYSSSKGQVNLDKTDMFSFDEMFACLESISRSRLDKSTYSKMALVERGEVSDSLRYDILNRDNFTCVICGASARLGARLHVDHIVPIAKGGKSTPDNLRTLCERCNIGKSDKIEVVNFSEMPVGREQKNSEKSTGMCERCGAKLVLRNGKYGSFYGCSRFPECKFAKKM